MLTLKMKNRVQVICFVVFLVICRTAFSVIEPRAMASDSRIKVITYSKDSIFKYIGYYNYQAAIELEKEEEVVSISMGDTTAWQIVPSGNLIFIKPIEENATTNMTLITNKRVYLFELYAEYTNQIRDPNITFVLKFLYNNDTLNELLSHKSDNIINFDRPEELNFLYSISGDEEIAPIKIFDDGDFTYLQFRNRNSQVPAMYSVGDDLKESIVNFKIDPKNFKLITIERVFKKLVLRLGDKIVCIYNEAYFI